MTVSLPNHMVEQLERFVNPLLHLRACRRCFPRLFRNRLVLTSARSAMLHLCACSAKLHSAIHEAVTRRGEREREPCRTFESLATNCKWMRALRGKYEGRGNGLAM